jgi:succinate dehydrogenase / fumarate reductase cytochrome b subunit
MLALGLHLYHGTWSAFQTLGLDGPRISRWREPLALGVALVVVVVNLSFPVAVYTGILQ